MPRTTSSSGGPGPSVRASSSTTTITKRAPKADGSPTPRGASSRALRASVVRVHRRLCTCNLHLPRTWGMFLVGLTGVALLSSLISGLLAHPRIFKDAFALRWGGSRRLQEADLHNRLSVWGLPFHFVVSLSGALLGLSTLIIGVLALAAYNGNSGAAFATLLGPRAGPDETAAPVARRRGDDPQGPEREARTPSSPACTSITSARPGRSCISACARPGIWRMANSYYFKGDGEPMGDGGFETGGVGQQILGALSAAALRLVRRLSRQDRLRRAGAGADRDHPQRRGDLARAPARPGAPGAGLGEGMGGRVLGPAACPRRDGGRRAAARRRSTACRVSCGDPRCVRGLRPRA